ncbi:MAG: DMT family transporter, partial [Eubacteriales bacterium]
MKSQMKANLLLLLVAAIWGAAFVAQSSGMDYIEPFTFMVCRYILGVACLLPVMYFNDKKAKKGPPLHLKKKDLILCAALCGIFMTLGCGTQQMGLQYTSAGKSGFITALYVVLVPVCTIFMGKKPSLKLWISVLLSCTALYLLCVDGEFTVGKGEILTLICAFMYVGHILVIDHFAGRVDAVKMSCLQFAVCGVLSFIVMLLTETPDWQSILDCWLPILYTGVLSTAVAFTLQAVAQTKTNPTTASIIMSLESCFGVLFGWIILH